MISMKLVCCHLALLAAAGCTDIPAEGAGQWDNLSDAAVPAAATRHASLTVTLPGLKGGLIVTTTAFIQTAPLTVDRDAT